MTQITNFTKTTDRTTFVGYPAVVTSPTTQVAAWAAGSNGDTPVDHWGDVLTGVPAASRVTVSGTGVTGANGAYTVSLSLSGTNTVQLTPGLTDALGNNSNPVGAFTYRSRSQQVTVDASGLVTAVARTNGGVIEIEYPAGQVSATGPSMPASTEKIYASLAVTVLA